MRKRAIYLLGIAAVAWIVWFAAVRVPKTHVEATGLWQETENEKQFLIDATAAGTKDSYSEANRLLQRYPDAALEAIRQGVSRHNDNWTCARLVAIAGKLPGDEPLGFLREQLRAAHRSTRLVAAAGLIAHGKEEGLLAVIKEWETARPSSESENDLTLMMDVLAACGRADGVLALGRDLKRWPVEIRYRIVEALSDWWPVGLTTSTLLGPAGLGWAVQNNQSSPVIRDAIDSILAAALEDQEEYPSLSYGNTFEPRVCDCSAQVLASRWKQADSFDINGTLQARNRQRLQLKNDWLTRQGLAPVPIPAQPEIRRAPEAQMRPLLRRIQDARSPEDLEEPEKSIMALGLPALLAVKEMLASLKQDHPAHDWLEFVAKRLACIVREVHFGAESAAPPKDLKKLIDGQVGKPLAATNIVGLVLAVIQDLPPGITGIKLIIEREGDDTGVSMMVELTTRRVHQGGTERGWSIMESIYVDKKPSHNSSGTSEIDFGRRKLHWALCAYRLTRAFAARPDQPLFVRLKCIAEGD